MNVSEKIAKKEEEIKREEGRIAASQTKIANLRKDIDTLQSLEIKAMLKEIDMPFDELKEFIKSMKTTPAVEPPGENKSES